MQISTYSVPYRINAKLSNGLKELSPGERSFSGMPVVDFEKYIEQTKALRSESDSGIVEINGQKVDINTIPVASFGDPSMFRRFPSTGSVAWDSVIELGLDYCASCFDFTNSRDFDKLTEAEDFTGMSNVEKYKAIYEKYQHCYGEDFLNADAIGYLKCPEERDQYCKIINAFFKEVAKACGGYGELRNIRKKALYGDMSDYDVRQAIIDKYTEDGNVTLADLYKLTREMDECGVGAQVGGMVRRFDLEVSFNYGNAVEVDYSSPAAISSIPMSGYAPYFDREKRLNESVSSKLLNDMVTLRGVPSSLIQDDYERVIGQIVSSLSKYAD